MRSGRPKRDHFPSTRSVEKVMRASSFARNFLWSRPNISRRYSKPLGEKFEEPTYIVEFFSVPINLFYLLCSVLLLIDPIWGHGGRKDRQGGHKNRKQENYHFHTRQLGNPII